MQDCVFCKIVEGKIPAKTVYKGLHAVAFLDTNPLARGHTLVVPTRHVERVEELSAEEMANYVSMLPRIVRAVQEGAGAQGSTIAWNNGRAAGQEVAHAHVHIVPRFPGDTAGPIHGMFRDRPQVTPTELDELTARIRKGLGQ